MSDTDPHFFLIKDTLEDMSLFLKEIEHTLDILESEPGDEIRSACEIRLAQLQQHLSDVNDTLMNQGSIRSKKKLL